MAFFDDAKRILNDLKTTRKQTEDAEKEYARRVREKQNEKWREFFDSCCVPLKQILSDSGDLFSGCTQFIKGVNVTLQYDGSSSLLIEIRDRAGLTSNKCFLVSPDLLTTIDQNCRDELVELIEVMNISEEKRALENSFLVSLQNKLETQKKNLQEVEKRISEI